MARQTSMITQLALISLLAPAADAAGRTSPFRLLKGADKAFLFVRVNQGNAATVALTPLQAKDASGTGSKALGITPIFLNADTTASDAYVAQAAAAGFTTSAALKDKIVMFEILPEACMDLANGYSSIAIQTGASNAANITEAHIHFTNPYEQATPPSTYL